MATDGPAEGDFVVEVDHSIGYAFCEDVHAGLATVRYVEMPDRVVERREVPVEALRPLVLPDEMRVWLRNKFFGWWPGRTQGLHPSGRYLVKLSGLEAPMQVPGESLFVRWDRPLQEPDLAVAIGMTDAVAFMAARQPVVRNLVRQRAACRGYTSVLSAAVRPYAHQLEVMARVLGDPVMRYVLADEVGLGKTIEAGLIVRQLLLDDPSATAVVSVPRPLQSQWADELRDKLLLHDELSQGRVHVVDHDDLALAAMRRPTMLVIDEAHRVIESALLDPVELEIVQTAASETPSLLLLTATPVRGNARTFLGLLHLVDPVTYRLDDLAAFEQRLALREEQASAIELLSTRTPSSILRTVLADFTTQYQGDDVVNHRVSRLVKDLDATGSADGQELAGLAAHLRETYRISRRVIRTRRSAAMDSGFPVSGRLLESVDLADPSRPAVDTFVERWRQLLRESERAPHLEVLFAVGLERALAGPLALELFIESRLEAIRAGDSDDVSSTEVALLEQTGAMLRSLGTEARLDALARYVQEAASLRREKFVVFSSFDDVAMRAAAVLMERFGPHAVAHHLTGDTADDQRDAIRRFVADPACSVFVCDASGEEGRNLQHSTRVIHLDLPLSINRLEQRIGRVDRFSESPRPTGVPSVVFFEAGSEWVASQLLLLRDGVGVFRRSVATLIQPLRALEARMTHDVLSIGLAGLTPDLAELRAELDAESEAIDLLEEIESTSAGSEFSLGALYDFEDFEESWGDTAEAFERLFSDDGGLRLREQADPDRLGVFSLAVDPQLRTVPLLPMSHLQQLGPHMRGRRTYNRAIARRVPGVRLVRLGDPLVDWIESYTRFDERGRASAVWRAIPGAEGIKVVYRFEFQLEFDDSGLTVHTAGVRRRLRRRGDAFLPPMLEAAWADEHGELPPDDVELIESAGGKGDLTLRGPRWARVIEAFPDWERRTRNAASIARAVVMDRSELRGQVQAALAAASTEAEQREMVLRLRRDRLADERERGHAERELAAEEALNVIVREGVTEPRTTMLTAMAVVVAGEPLEL